MVIGKVALKLTGGIEMIIYVTKETFARYKFKMPEDMSDPLVRAVTNAVLCEESGDRLQEWGGKLFYFDHRKCLQLVNFASKLTLILVDVKMADREGIGNIMANYMLKLYEDNPQMTKLLERHFAENPAVCFAHLKDKSAIATLNRTQSDYLHDGYRLYDYISGGILHTIALNHDINWEWSFTQKINGKTEYIRSAERFEQLLLDRYSK